MRSIRPPLVDLRVIAVEQYGAGPWATMQLADLGADVIKVEDPATGGDVGRYVPPYQHDRDSLFFESFNRGKRSVALDLRRPEGRRGLADLAGTADAVFCNLRGDGPAKLGLRYDDLRAANQALVCCSLSGFGTDGQRHAEGAYDFTIQGLAGWQSITGGPDEPPTRSGLSIVDFSAGYVAALALVAGVWQARATGVGGDIDLSMFEIALSQLNYMATWVATHGYRPVRQPRSAHQSLVPFGNFPARDGWVVLACPKESLWRRLCQALGHPEWSADRRFETFADRNRNRVELTALIDAALRDQSVAHWLDRLGAAGVPCAPINDVAAALEDRQAVERRVVGEVRHPRLGRVRQVRTPFRMPGVSGAIAPAPAFGEDTRDVLGELGGYAAGVRK
jgi:crotonobetainyl-CoA:carnitine CoA-transferase CaiB-like acyl-CoA transferase